MRKSRNITEYCVMPCYWRMDWRACCLAAISRRTGRHPPHHHLNTGTRIISYYFNSIAPKGTAPRDGYILKICKNKSERRFYRRTQGDSHLNIKKPDTGIQKFKNIKANTKT